MSQLSLNDSLCPTMQDSDMSCNYYGMYGCCNDSAYNELIVPLALTLIMPFAMTLTRPLDMTLTRPSVPSLALILA